MPENDAQVVTEVSLAVHSVEQFFQLSAKIIVASRLQPFLRQPETAVAADQAAFAQKAQQQPFELRAAVPGPAQEIAYQTITQMTPDHARAGLQPYRNEDSVLQASG